MTRIEREALIGSWALAIFIVALCWLVGGFQ